MDLVAGKIVFVVYRFVCNSFKVDKIFADIADAKIYIGKMSKNGDCMYHFDLLLSSLRVVCMSFRWKAGVPYSQKKRIERKQAEAYKDMATADIVEGFLFLCMETLHDEFGFGDKRLNQFRDRLVKKIDCINADYVQRLDIKGNFKMIEK